MKILPLSTLTGYVLRSTQAGGLIASPVLILKIPWCMGHSISSSITKPSSK